MNGRLFGIFGAALAFAVLVIAAAGVPVPAGDRVLLAPDTPESKIIRMNPKDVDPSLLPLDTIEELGTTGVPPEIDIETWRLRVTGKRVRNSLSLTYDELASMTRIKKKVLLICPGFFADYAEWEGVPLDDILETARVSGGYDKLVFRSEDGWRTTFSRETVKDNLLFLALKVNGEPLPREHGFPARLVAEDVLGGDWIKWVSSIEVE